MDAPERLTRRDLLRAASLGAAGAALFGPTDALAQNVREKSPYGMFRMGIQSYSLRGYKVDEALAKTKALGLTYWEAFNSHLPVTDDPKVIAEYKEKLKANGVRLVAYGVLDFSDNEADARRKFAFAKAMGIETFSAHPAPGAFSLLDRLVEEYGVNIAIHNHGPGDNLYDKIDKTLTAIQGHSVRIGSCSDTGHYLRSDEDPVEAARKFGKRLYGVHLKDVLVDSDGKKHFTEIGKGKLDTVGLLKVLRQNRFRGLLSLEYEEHAENPISYIEACLAAVREAVRKI